MNPPDLYLPQHELDQAYAQGPAAYLALLADAYLRPSQGQLTPERMDALSDSQHALLCYHITRNEVSEGGFIQLIQNGYGPYVLDGPFPYTMKKGWGLRDFGQYLFDVRREYHRRRDALEADLSDDDFMALYEQEDAMNELGDRFLDDFEETVTPQVANYVRDHETDFNTIHPQRDPSQL